MQSIRNIAIIAHVDHGKTTLVDRIIQECKVLDERKEAVSLFSTAMTSRGKGNHYYLEECVGYLQGVKINIIDTRVMLISEERLKGC